MSKTQDVFGSSPKSVLNKPLMIVQHTEPVNTSGGATSPSSWTDSVLNRVTVNEITGASLANNVLTLPAGEYYIDGHLVANATVASIGALRDNVSGVMLVQGGNIRVNNTNPDSAVAPISGKLILLETTAIKLSLYCESGSSDGFGRTHSSWTDGDNIYANIQIWKLDEDRETVILSDPTMVLARPLMHVQDQKASGAAGGNSSTGENQRELNTTLTNEISGATLNSGNTITLPAGEYFITASAPSYNATENKLTLKDSLDAVLITGTSERSASTSSVSTSSQVWGRVTLLATTTIKLIHNIANATSTDGLGRPSAIVGINEVYTDIQIWQMDAVVKQPVIVNDKLFPLPGSVMNTGNIHGLDYEYTSTSTITVGAGVCMDSTNEFSLTLSTQQVVTIPGGADAIYHLFLTDDNELVKVDTDIDGANLPAQDKRRWIGFVVTGTGAVKQFTQSGDEIIFDFHTDEANISAVTPVNVAGMIPEARCHSFVPAMFNSTACEAVLYYDAAGSQIIDFRTMYANTWVHMARLQAGRSYWAAASAGVSWVFIRNVKMKR